ncbi:hypothetical protein ACQ86E_00940 [Bradyrhizobium betae]|uniref:hypothetical protein n=1 Tax=Bradyrhizobium betae TaxID=244734 RepID=UPI003D6664E2
MGADIRLRGGKARHCCCARRVMHERVVTSRQRGRDQVDDVVVDAAGESAISGNAARGKGIDIGLEQAKRDAVRRSLKPQPCVDVRNPAADPRAVEADVDEPGRACDRG